MKRISILLASLTLYASASGARIDTINIPSPSMHKQIKAVVVNPEQVTPQQVPCVYLLHGHGGNYSDWIRQMPDLGYWADLLGLMIVCPDGNHGSWYFDSPIDSTYRYETHIIKEVIPYIDSHYPTLPKRNGRGITGLSMGGHGALYLAFRHQDVFGSAGSMSGGVDFRPFPANWDIAKRLGSYEQHRQAWECNTVINLTHLINPDSLALLIDCGTKDFFLQVNQALHQKLLSENIPHDFIVRPGAHNWDYWRDALPYQLLFMSRNFNTQSH